MKVTGQLRQPNLDPCPGRDDSRPNMDDRCQPIVYNQIYVPNVCGGASMNDQINPEQFNYNKYRYQMYVKPVNPAEVQQAPAGHVKERVYVQPNTDIRPLRQTTFIPVLPTKPGGETEITYPMTPQTMGQPDVTTACCVPVIPCNPGYQNMTPCVREDPRQMCQTYNRCDQAQQLGKRRVDVCAEIERTKLPIKSLPLACVQPKCSQSCCGHPKPPQPCCGQSSCQQQYHGQPPCPAPCCPPFRVGHSEPPECPPAHCAPPSYPPPCCQSAQGYPPCGEQSCQQCSRPRNPTPSSACGVPSCPPRYATPQAPTAPMQFMVPPSNRPGGGCLGLPDTFPEPRQMYGQPCGGAGQYGGNPGQYGGSQGQYGGNPGQYGGSQGQYGGNPGQYGVSPAQYGGRSGGCGDVVSYFRDHVQVTDGFSPTVGPDKQLVDVGTVRYQDRIFRATSEAVAEQQRQIPLTCPMFGAFGSYLLARPNRRRFLTGTKDHITTQGNGFAWSYPKHQNNHCYVIGRQSRC